MKMPTITVQQKTLEMLLELQGLTHNIEEIQDRLPLLGTDIDSCDVEQLVIEIFPDRPDLLSAETLSHSMRSYLHDDYTRPNLDISPGDVEFHVDSELSNIRPIILGAVVKGVHTGSNDEEIDIFIKGLMEHQEKLHFALGRGRKKVSIGVHDLETISPPFRVKACSPNTRFIPLAMEEEMSLSEILEKHPKGIEYAGLLEGMDKFPVIFDSDDKVLSFPPIINGSHTTVSKTTKNFLIDVTGWDRRACETALSLVCLQLAARKGVIESVTVNNSRGETEIQPSGQSNIVEVPMRLLPEIIGIDLSEEEIRASLQRMGMSLVEIIQSGDEYPEFPEKMSIPEKGGKVAIVEVPNWRFDILHPIDIIEDIIIGHGYENLPSSKPSSSMTGVPRADHNMRRRLREALQGLGFTQIQSLTLSNDADQFENMRWTANHEVTRITNPITIDHTLLRHHLLPGILRLLSKNKHNELPHSVYELGTVVRDHKNKNRVAFITAEKSGGFAAVRGRIQAIMQDLGASFEANSEMVAEISALEDGEGPWLAGRAAKIEINGIHVGCFGEIDPSISEIFELNVPLNGAEFDVDLLLEVLGDPV